MRVFGIFFLKKFLEKTIFNIWIRLRFEWIRIVIHSLLRRSAHLTFSILVEVVIEAEIARALIVAVFFLTCTNTVHNFSRAVVKISVFCKLVVVEEPLRCAV